MSAELSPKGGSALRERQTKATREEIVDVAMQLIAENSEVPHELIASKAGMSSRTVYRHFPDRVSLMLAVWQRLREMMQIEFPSSEEEILPLTKRVFGAMDANEVLVNAVMFSVAGARIGRMPGYEGRKAFTESLRPRLTGLPAKQRRWIVGAFVAIYSAPFWQLLRNRGELSADESQEAVAWILTTLLDDLHSKSKRKRKIQ